MSVPAPDISILARWLHSWVQPNGAIHGFNSHPVSGGNSYRSGEFTSGHSALAAPLLPALALALKDRPDKRGSELLRRLVDFQSHINQLAVDSPDTLMARMALSQVGYLAPEVLGAERVSHILESAGLSAAAEPSGLSYLDYLRQWANFEFLTLGGNIADAEIRSVLEFLVDSFHIYGVPDMESEGALVSLQDQAFMAPASHYGWMLFPLVEAATRYEERLFLEAAQALARHVVRSSWTDKNGQRRLHRHWLRRDETWSKANQPMLLGGAGLTLAGLQHLIHIAPDAETEAFLVSMDATYDFYQHPSGFFAPASGWGSEPDIIPSTAWQSHDLFYLLLRHGTPPEFWDTLFQPQPGVAVLLGPSLIWTETQEHWSVRGYATQHGLELAGRKDEASFEVDSGNLPLERQLPDQPVFARTNDGVVQTAGRDDVWVLESV